MKVLLIGNYPFDRQFSMKLFSEMLVKGISDSGFDAELMCPQPFTGNLWPSKYGIGKWFGYVDKFAIFPRQIRAKVASLRASKEPTIVHICDQGNAYYRNVCVNVPVLVTCHDMIAIMSAFGKMKGAVVKWTGKRHQQIIFGGLRKCDYYAFVSENTRSDLNRLFSPPISRQCVIYNQLDSGYRPMALQECARLLSEIGLPPLAPFILHVGDNQWYKNRMCVLRLFRRLRERPHRREQLVMVGPPLSKEQSHYAEKAGISNRITQLSNLSSTELNALYSSAALFVFPSFYEGFGWPPIEAQAAGCPVVSSNGGSLGEILSGSAMVTDPLDETAMLKNMQNVLDNDELRRRLVNAGIINAARFKPPSMVTGYIELYRRIIQEAFSP